jgi:3-methylfumaryl-CoA hydratase
MSGGTDALDAAIDGWAPPPVEVIRTVLPGPNTGFADLLDDQVDAADGAAIPPAWHWFAFTPSCPQHELGDDGHPEDGPFLPPLANRRRMLAGGRLRYTAPMRVGETYTRRSELTAARVKDGRSGRMLFTTVRHVFTRSDATVALTEEEYAVYRQQEPGAPRGLAAPSSDGPGWDEHLGARGRRSLDPDPRALFRFSALTYNTHRIHYDHDYVRDVEGYPDLVVQGPLLALLMLEVPRAAGVAPSAFRYRLLAPAFSGTPVVATWDDDALRVGTVGATRAGAEATIEV